jgi:hypothetical protein
MHVLIKAFVGNPFTLEIRSTDDLMLVKKRIQEKIMIPPDQQCLKIGKKKIEEIDEILSYLTDKGSRVPLLRVVHDRSVHHDSICCAFHEAMSCVSRMILFGFMATFLDIH